MVYNSNIVQSIFNGYELRKFENSTSNTLIIDKGKICSKVENFEAKIKINGNYWTKMLLFCPF
jgi:hypothetical protein